MAENAFAPVTPGEILKDEFLTEYWGYRRTSCEDDGHPEDSPVKNGDLEHFQG